MGLEGPVAERFVVDLTEAGVVAAARSALAAAVEAVAPGRGAAVHELRSGRDLLAAALPYPGEDGVGLDGPIYADDLTGFGLGAPTEMVFAALWEPSEFGLRVAAVRDDRRISPHSEIGVKVFREAHHAVVVGPRDALMAVIEGSPVDADSLCEFLSSRVRHDVLTHPFVIAYVDPKVRVGLLAIVQPGRQPYGPLLFRVSGQDEPWLVMWSMPPAPELADGPLRSKTHFQPETVGQLDQSADVGDWINEQLVETEQPLVSIDEWWADDRSDCGTRLWIESDVGREAVTLVVEGPTCQACDLDPVDREVEAIAQISLQPVSLIVELRPQRPPEQRPTTPDPPVDETLKTVQALVETHSTGRTDASASTETAGEAFDPQELVAFCDGLAAIARLLDRIRAWVGLAIGRAVDVVLQAAGMPPRVSDLIGGVVGRAVAGHLLRPVRSLANTLRLAGMSICAADGREVSACRCARDLAGDLLKHAVTATGHDLTMPAAARVFNDLESLGATDVLPADRAWRAGIVQPLPPTGHVTDPPQATRAEALADPPPRPTDLSRRRRIKLNNWSRDQGPVETGRQASDAGEAPSLLSKGLPDGGQRDAAETPVQERPAPPEADQPDQSEGLYM